MSHKKDAHANAAEKIAARDHLAGRPAVPVSDAALNRTRFPGETPLTGEDRPLGEAGGKRAAADPQAVSAHAAAGPIPTRRDGEAERVGGTTELPDAQGADYKKWRRGRPPRGTSPRGYARGFDVDDRRR